MNLAKNKSSSKVLNEKTVAEVNLLQKLKPRQVTIEKERLYEENLELKLISNNLKEENLKLKTKIQQMEKEINKKEENEEKHAYSIKPPNLVANFKSKIKDLKNQLREKTEEIEKLTKNIKSSKIFEQEKEISAYVEECSRLKKIIEATLGPNENLHKVITEKYSDLNSMIEDINKENKDLHKSLAFHKQELEKARQKILENEKRKKKMTSNKSDVQLLKKEIFKLKELNESLARSIDEGSNKEKMFREEVFKLKKALKDSKTRTLTLEASLKEANFQIVQLSQTTQKGNSTTETVLPLGLVEPMPLMVKTVRLALGRAGVSVNSFFEGLDKSKTGKVSYDEFSQALQRLGTYLTNSHFNSVPSACLKNEFMIDLNVLERIVKESSKILIIDSKEQTPIVSTFDFESPVHPGKGEKMLLGGKQVESPKDDLMKISIFPPVDNTKQVNSDSCKHSKRSKGKKFEVFVVSDEDSKNSKTSKNPKSRPKSKTSDKRKSIKRASRDSEDKSSQSLISQEPVYTRELLSSFEHICYKMQLNRLLKSKLQITLFGAIDKDKVLTRAELFQFLQKSPFSIKNGEISDPLLDFFITSGSTARLICEKMLPLLQEWEVFTAEDEEVFDYQLGLIISKNKSFLKTKCKEADKDARGSIKVSDFEKILSELGVVVPDRLWSYMKLLFYSNDSELDVMPYRYFIKAYGNPIESRHEHSNISESPDSQTVNFYLSAICSALASHNLHLSEVFECDEDGLIFIDQFLSGLKLLGFEEIDEEQVSIVMEALRYQGSYDLCLSLQEMTEILQNFDQCRLSNNPSGSQLELPDHLVTEDSKKFGIIKLIKNDSFEDSPVHLSV
jgi:Ca2+-binding EF-hand superfamily protein